MEGSNRGSAKLAEILGVVRRLLKENCNMSPLLYKKVELLDKACDTATPVEKEQCNNDIADTYKQIIARFQPLGLLDDAKKNIYDARASSSKDSPSVTSNSSSTNTNKEIKLPTNLQPIKDDLQVATTIQITYSLWLLTLPNEWLKYEPSLESWQIKQRNNHNWKLKLNTLKLGVIYSFFYDKEKNDKTISEVLSLAIVLDKDEVKIIIQALTDKMKPGLEDEVARHLVDGLSYLIRNVHSDLIDVYDIIMALDHIDSLFETRDLTMASQMIHLALAISRLLDAIFEAGLNIMKQNQINKTLPRYLEFLQNSRNNFLTFQSAYTSCALFHISASSTLGNAGEPKYNYVDLQDPNEIKKMIKKIKTGSSKEQGTDEAYGWYLELQRARVAIQTKQPEVVYTWAGELVHHHNYLILGFYHLLKEVLSMDSFYEKHKSHFNDAIFRQKKDIFPLDDFRSFISRILDQIDMSEIDYPLLKDLEKPEMSNSHSEASPHQFPILYDLCPSVTPGNELNHLLHKAQAMDLEKTPILYIWKSMLNYFCNDIYIPPKHIIYKNKGKFTLKEIFDSKTNPCPVKKSSIAATDHSTVTTRPLNNAVPGEKTDSNSNTTKSLMDSVLEYLDEQNCVKYKRPVLIHGDSGSGKSLFCKILLRKLWDKYQTPQMGRKNCHIPVFINLLEVADTGLSRNISILDWFMKLGIMKSQAEILKKNHTFIFICDGYNESQLVRNLQTEMKTQGWNSHILVSCRSEYLTSGYQHGFYDNERYYLEARIAPFDDNQIMEFVKGYLKTYTNSEATSTSLDILNSTVSLKDLKTNALFLKFALETIQEKSIDQSNKNTSSSLGVKDFDVIIQKWINYHFSLICEMEWTASTRDIIENWSQEVFKKECINYLKGLALITYNEPNQIVNYNTHSTSHSNPNNNRIYFGDDIHPYKVARIAFPPARYDTYNYWFYHDSIYNYALSLAVFDTIETTNNKTLLEMKLLCMDTSTIQFLADRVRDNNTFKGWLWDIINGSKSINESDSDPSTRAKLNAAANAISILVRANEFFEDCDLENIKIPGADLTNGCFRNANFKNANLSNVIFHNTVLENAQFDGAIVDGVILGHLSNIPILDIMKSWNESLKLPELNAVIKDNFQLAYSLYLLNSSQTNVDTSPKEKIWLEEKKKNIGEQSRLESIADEVIADFVVEPKSKASISEVLCYTAVHAHDQKQIIDHLLNINPDDLGKSPLDSIHPVSFLIGNSQPETSNITDVEIGKIIQHLNIFKTRLSKSIKTELLRQKAYEYILSVSYFFDSMVDFQKDTRIQKIIKDSNVYESLRDLLSIDMKNLESASDIFLYYQIAYAYQALLYISDVNSSFDISFRDAHKICLSSFGVVCASKSITVAKITKEVKRVQGIKPTSSSSSEPTESFLKSFQATSEKDDNQPLIDSLSKQSIDTHKSGWYLALRGCNVLIQRGQFGDFKTLVLGVSCKNDPAFQLGVCQQLGSIALNSLLDVGVRQSASGLLCDIYLRKLDDTNGWKTHMVAIQSASCILHYISQENTEIKSAISMALGSQTLKSNDYPIIYPSIPIHKSTEYKLFTGAQKKSSEEPALFKLRKHIMSLYEKEKDKVYIPSRASWIGEASEDFDLQDEMQRFIQGDNKVFLILGESGVGKSTFTKVLENDLWDKYKINGLIPLFIFLPSILNSTGSNKEDNLKDLIGVHLKSQRREKVVQPNTKEYERIFSDDEILLLKKKKRTIVLICDGYDEIKSTENLYDLNRFNEKDGWQVKMIISCRTEYKFTGKYKDWFQPQTIDSDKYIEATVIPFNRAQIDEYIDNYAGKEKSKEIKQTLFQEADLKDLAKNPFLLKLLVYVISTHTIVDKVTRTELYDRFIGDWIDRNRLRIEETDYESTLDANEKDYFETLKQDPEKFRAEGIKYLTELSAAIFENQNGVTTVSYSKDENQPEWKHNFFRSSKRVENMMRHFVPLVRYNNTYRFIHKSVLEYGLVRYMFDPQKSLTIGETVHNKAEVDNQHSLSRKSSSDSFRSIDGATVVSSPIISTTEQLIASPFGANEFSNVPSIMGFLVERVKQHQAHIDLLQKTIELSKNHQPDSRVAIAAANAISILVKAGVSFSKSNLHTIKIPRANLVGGIFDSVDFRNAYLQNVNFEKTWIQRSNFDGSDMTDVKFGKLPDLIEESNIKCSGFSPNGKLYAVGLANGHVRVYDTVKWGCKHHFVAAENLSIQTLIFANESSHLISVGKAGKSVRIWNIEADKEKLIYNLSSHTDAISSIVYSAKKNIIVTGSYDFSVSIWDFTSKQDVTCKELLHKHRVSSVALVHEDSYIVSSCEDKTIRLWDIKDMRDIKSIDLMRQESLSQATSMVVASSDGQYFASYNHSTIYLWDAFDDIDKIVGSIRKYELNEGIGTIIFSPIDFQLVSVNKKEKNFYLWNVSKHKVKPNANPIGDIISAAFSPKGNQIALGTVSGGIKIFDTRTGSCNETRKGYCDKIQSIAFSPNVDQITATYRDRVRIWSLEPDTNIGENNSKAAWVVYSPIDPNGQYIVSGGMEKKIDIWDADTGDNLYSLDCKSEVVKVAFSPSREQIVSGGLDKKVRLWSISSEPGEIKVYGGHNGGITCVAYSPNGYWFASGSNDNTIRIWGERNDVEYHVLSGHKEPITCIEFSSQCAGDNPNSDLIASGSLDGYIKLWNAALGTCIHTLPLNKWSNHSNNNSNNVDNSLKGITCIAFSPDGNQIASGDNGNTICVWDVSSGNLIHTINSHTAAITRILYTDNGQNIVSASRDGFINAWKLQATNPEKIFSVLGHNGGVESIDYVKKEDKEMIISGGRDNSAKIWDLNAKAETPVCTIEHHSKYVSSVCFSPKGDNVVTAGLDMRLCISDAASGEIANSLHSYKSQLTETSSSNMHVNQHNRPESNPDIANEDKKYSIVAFPT
ncbi:WD_REPEATS_REGION domain-containing protein, partial [Entomortierella beljakovae]